MPSRLARCCPSRSQCEAVHSLPVSSVPPRPSGLVSMKTVVLRGEPAPSAAPKHLLPKRPGIRKNPGLFQLGCLFLFFSFPAVIALRMCQWMCRTTQRVAHRVFNNLHWSRAGTGRARVSPKFADIAQVVERESSKLNVVSSILTVRSISGVPVHDHAAQSRERCVGCAGVGYNTRAAREPGSASC
jgi:hypothetical protein